MKDWDNNLVHVVFISLELSFPNIRTLDWPLEDSLMSPQKLIRGFKTTSVLHSLVLGQLCLNICPSSRSHLLKVVCKTECFTEQASRLVLVWKSGLS